MLTKESWKIREPEDFDPYGSQVVVFVGPPGAGKTTTLMKWAGNLAVPGGDRQQKLQLATIDQFHLANRHHLENFSSLLGVPFQATQDPQELRELVESLPMGGILLIDTEGGGRCDSTRLAAQRQFLEAAPFAHKTFLTVSAITQLEVLRDTLVAYREWPLDGVIVTNLDQANSLDVIHTFLVESNLPVVAVTDGQRIHKDFHWGPAMLLDRRESAYQ